MNNEKYYQVFKMLGIPIEPLPSDYSPEEYGRRLYSALKPDNGVSYATSTDYVANAQTKESKNNNE